CCEGGTPEAQSHRRKTRAVSSAGQPVAILPSLPFGSHSMSWAELPGARRTIRTAFSAPASVSHNTHNEMADGRRARYLQPVYPITSSSNRAAARHTTMSNGRPWLLLPIALLAL